MFLFQRWKSSHSFRILSLTSASVPLKPLFTVQLNRKENQRFDILPQTTLPFFLTLKTDQNKIYHLHSNFGSISSITPAMSWSLTTAWSTVSNWRLKEIKKRVNIPSDFEAQGRKCIVHTRLHEISRQISVKTSHLLVSERSKKYYQEATKTILSWRLVLFNTWSDKAA